MKSLVVIFFLLSLHLSNSAFSQCSDNEYNGSFSTTVSSFTDGSDVFILQRATLFTVRNESYGTGSNQKFCGRPSYISIEYINDGLQNFTGTASLSNTCFSGTVSIRGFRFQVSYSPDVSLPNITYTTSNGNSATTNLCTDETLTLTVNNTDFNGRYVWSYSSPSKSGTLSGSSNTINVNYSDLNIPFREGVTFSCQIGNCTGSSHRKSSPTFRYYPDPPTITTSPSPSAPDCFGEDGSITFNSGDLSRAPGSGETFTFMIYEGTSEPTFLSSIDEDTDFADLPMTVDGGSKTYNGSSVSFDLPPNSGSNNYYLLIFPSISNESTILSSGCGRPDFYDFTVSDTPEITITETGRVNPACRDDNASLSLSIGNGQRPYDITVGGRLFSNVNDDTPTLSVPIANVDEAFSVTVTERTGGRCSKTVSGFGQFTNPASFSVSAGISTDVACFGDDAVINASTGVSGTFTYELRRNSDDVLVDTQSGPGTGAGVDLTGPAGSYYVIATNSNTCPSTNQAPVSTATPSELIFTSEESTSPTCISGAGDDDGTITVVARGSNGVDCGGCLYSITSVRPEQSSGVFTGLQANVPYEVVVREGTCTQTTTITIAPDATPLSFTATPTDQRCSYEESGEITITDPQNALGSITYILQYPAPDNSVITNSTGSFTGLAAGSYQVSIDDGTCRTATQSVSVGSPSALSITDFTTTPASCNGSTDGTITITVGGGTPGYTYSWLNEADEEVSTTNSVMGGAGDYRVTITDANGCELEGSYTITEPEVLVAEYEKTDISCRDFDDGTITLINITGGNNGPALHDYAWTDNGIPNTTINASTRTNLPPGTYSVVITDTEGCEFAINDIEIINPSELTITVADQTEVGCKNEATGSITLSAGGGVGVYEYQLNGGAFQSSSIFTDLLAGDYTLTVRDDNNCTATTTTTITEPAEVLSVTLEEENATCDTDGRVTATVSGGTPPYAYEWRSTFPGDELLPDTDNEIIVPAGSYPLRVTDANGCEVTATGNLSSDDGAMITIISQTQPGCSYLSDGTATISLTGIAPFTTTWDHGETGESPTQLSVGDNWFNVVDANGCLVRDRVTFTNPEPLAATITDQTLPSCNGATDGTLTIAISGGNGNYTAMWNNGQRGNTITDLTAGDYEVTIRDDNACELLTTFTLPEKPLLTLELLPTNPSCDDNIDGQIIAQVNGGNGGYQYEWSEGTTTADLTDLPEGTYSLTVTDALGCTATASTTLTDPPLTTFEMDDLSICSGQEYKVRAPVQALSYRWTGPNNFEETGREAVLSEPGTYTLDIQDLINCPASTTFTVEIDDEALQADFLVAGRAYVGDTLMVIDISWPIPSGVTWELPEAARVITRTQDFAEIVFDSIGTYSLLMFCELGGCSASYEQTIEIVDKPAADQQAFAFRAPDEPLLKNLQAHPNPTTDRFTVQVSLKEEEDISLQLIDLQGNAIKYEKTLSGSKEHVVRLDATEMLPGLYLLHATTNNESKTIRLLVK